MDLARQAPLSMGFSRQEYGVGCHCLLQGIFPILGSNLGLLHCRWILYHLSHQGSPDKGTENQLESSKYLLPQDQGLAGTCTSGFGWGTGLRRVLLLSPQLPVVVAHMLCWRVLPAILRCWFFLPCFTQE